MIAKAIFLINAKEIDNVMDSNIKYGLNNKIPEKKYEIDNFYFKMSSVDYCFRTTEGNINISVNNMIWTIKHEKDVWDKITNYLKKDNV